MSKGFNIDLATPSLLAKYFEKLGDYEPLHHRHGAPTEVVGYEKPIGHWLRPLFPTTPEAATKLRKWLTERLKEPARVVLVPAPPSRRLPWLLAGLALGTGGAAFGH